MNAKLPALILSALFALAGKAQQPTDALIRTGNTPQVTINADATVVLVQSATADETFSANGAARETLRVTAGPSALRIDGSADGKTVYLYVQNLKSLTLVGNAQVRTQGWLRSPKLDVFVEEGTTAVLRTAGAVNAYGLDGNEVHVTRKPLLASAASAASGGQSR